MNNKITDLGLGQTEDSLFPVAELARASAEVFTASNSGKFQYAPEAGIDEAREAIAKFIYGRTGSKVGQDEIFITNGISNALDMVIRIFVPPGGVVLVEDPTYFFALNILRDCNIQVLPVPVEHDGINVDLLRRLLQTHPVKLLYIIPFHQNPTGVTLSPEKWIEIKKLATEFSFMIFSDEVYQFVGDRPFDSLYSTGDELVLSAGSFSKILAPGMRLGWIRTSRRNINKLSESGLMLSAGGVSPAMSLVVARIISSGAQHDILARLNNDYSQKRARMTAIIERELASKISYSTPNGGFFVWIGLPREEHVREARKEARLNGIDFRPGDEFSWSGSFKNFIRLGYTFYRVDEIDNATTRLCQIINGVIVNR